MDSASTYFVTTVSYNKAFLLQSDRMAGLFVDVLQHYRRAHQISVHEFVVMPNHVHVLITPSESIETTVKRIKGCFSTRAIREFRFRQKIWQPSFYKRRVRDSAGYSAFRTYIHQNPVKARLVSDPRDWRFSSASEGFELDPPPAWAALRTQEILEDVTLLRGM